MMLMHEDDPEIRRLRLQESIVQGDFAALEAKFKAALKEIERLRKLLAAKEGA